MTDEYEQLLADSRLRELLAHYAALATHQPDAWHDRLADLPGATGPELTNLHGFLLAHDWIAMNVGGATRSAGGAVSRCYRLTKAGSRALRLVVARGRWRRPGDETA